MLAGMRQARERGDTLIEVIFATAVLSLIIVIALQVMNAGTAQVERAVEGTFVRQEIDSQSELLRFERDAYVDHAPNIWSTIIAQRVDTPDAFTSLTSLSSCIPKTRAFWLKTDGTNVSVQSGFAAPVTYAAAGNGVWIEATPTGATNYVDFYLYACWDPPSGGGKSTSGTIVRLYAPAN